MKKARPQGQWEDVKGQRLLTQEGPSHPWPPSHPPLLLLPQSWAAQGRPRLCPSSSERGSRGRKVAWRNRQNRVVHTFKHPGDIHTRQVGKHAGKLLKTQVKKKDWEKPEERACDQVPPEPPRTARPAGYKPLSTWYCMSMQTVFTDAPGIRTLSDKKTKKMCCHLFKEMLHRQNRSEKSAIEQWHLETSIGHLMVDRSRRGHET